ncbi:MAG: sulfatase-like hydrolase/transferase [Candidatus Lokiarchaeota archaeon]|nr:sulfatase-like hydrolase/transferase [Candidatus Lokiarchaeota archaeon]
MEQENKRKKPNIVLIMTDTQGTNVIGCYGRPKMKTPNLDKMAKEGIKFQQAYTCQPVCGPARSAIFTGVYPHSNGVLANNMPIGNNIRTIGQRLQDNDYHTAFIGKWHLDGFDYFGTGNCPEGWDPKYWYDGKNYIEDLTAEERKLWRQKLNRAGNIHKYEITEEFTWAHRCSDRAIDFLNESTKSEMPFFLVVSYDEPHGPSTCPPPYCDMFKNFHYNFGENIKETFENKPNHQEIWSASTNLTKLARLGLLSRIVMRMYFGCNSYVDYEIGRVLNAIDELFPETFVIFTSDHGTPLLSHKLLSKGPAMYQETTNIPLIVKWKDKSLNNAVYSHPISQIDITPTILDAAGLECPPFLQGKSFLKALEDPNEKIDNEVFLEFTRYEVNHDGWGGFQPIRCVFDGRYKLVINLLSSDELYDLKKDPEELNNLITSRRHKKTRRRLHDKILEWMDTTRDPFRGYVWEERPWRKRYTQGWHGSGKTRPRKDDGYEPRARLYETAEPVDKWEYKK